MQNSQKTDFCSQMLRIRRYLQKGLRGGAKEQIVNHSLVLQGERCQAFREGKNNVEIVYRQKFRLARRKPFNFCQCLTFRTMPIATRIV